jgi:hypothetical protein
LLISRLPKRNRIGERERVGRHGKILQAAEFLLAAVGVSKCSAPRRRKTAHQPTPRHSLRGGEVEIIAAADRQMALHPLGQETARARTVAGEDTFEPVREFSPQDRQSCCLKKNHTKPLLPGCFQY